MQRTFFFVTLLVTFSLQSSSGQTLMLEYAQEGDPQKPRALIVIHDALKDRESLSLFLRTWGDRDRGWARSQYCAVYTYQFESGFEEMDTPEILAADLLERVQRHRVKTARSDSTNPYPKAMPSDARQPHPDLSNKDTEILIAGVGYGGLVARDFARQAKRENRVVSRVAFLSSPLDGLPLVRLLLAFPELKSSSSLSKGWDSLIRLSGEARISREDFRDSYSSSHFVLATSVQRTDPHPTDNVLYGRGAPLPPDRKAGNGLFGFLSMLGLYTGPELETPVQTTEGIAQGELSEQFVEVLLAKLVDQRITYDFLWRRQQIEEFIRGDGGLEPLYIYWDERDNEYVVPQWREAYASRRGLYEMMWF